MGPPARSASLVSGLVSGLVAGLAATLAAGPGQAETDAAARSHYILRCAGCHGMGGEGTVAGGIPAFPGSIGAIASLDAERSYMIHVPGVTSARLTDAEAAGVMNWILARWGGEHEAARFDAEEVAERRRTRVANVVERRREVAALLASRGIALAEYPWP